MNISYLNCFYRMSLHPYYMRTMKYQMGYDAEGKFIIYYVNGVVRFQPIFEREEIDKLRNRLYLAIWGHNIDGVGNDLNIDYSPNLVKGLSWHPLIYKELRYHKPSMANNKNKSINKINIGKVSMIREVSFKLADEPKQLTIIKEYNG